LSNNDVSDTPEEKEFRERYAQELRKKKMLPQSSLNRHFGSDEISDELAHVRRQMLLTPGRRGEQIKLEEINKEISRRNNVKR
jgi:hypothetical protein